MKFELEPENRGAPDDVLLRDLKEVAARLSAESVSREQYERLGRFHPKTLVKRFGSWNCSLELAGLRVKKPHLVSREEFIADLRRVASVIGSKSVTVEQYNKFGKFSTKPLPRLFGQWRKALAAADLEPSGAYKAPLTESELFENLEVVWRAVGRQPRQSDFRQPLSKVGPDAYVRRFGSWRKALERFVECMNDPSAVSSPQAESSVNSVGTHTYESPDIEVPGTSRTVNWRLRFLVMRRDNFKCVQCGASPALIPGTVLVIDHVVPWSKGGQTTIENLQTLCALCNGGKSDLVANAV